MNDGGDLRAFLSLLRRRKVFIVATIGAVLATAVGWLSTVSPTYRSTSTVAVVPTGGDSVTLLSQINVLVALYASAAKADQTVALARTMLNARYLPAPTVRTSRDTPTLNIEVSGRDPSTAQREAQAVTEALLQRATSGETSIPGIKLIQIDPPVVPAKPAWPRRSVVMAVAAAIGVLLALVGAYVREAAQPSHIMRATRKSRSQPAWPPAEWQGRVRAEEAASPVNAPELAGGLMAEPSTPVDAVPNTTNGDLRISSGHPENYPGASHGHVRPKPHRHTWRF
jgi:capsular polysaccharide biosynthesis protein